jgi:hypothetical protein
MSQLQRGVRRPASVVATTAVLLFLGLTALGGGIELILYRHGGTFVDAAWLELIPFNTFLVPGLILAGGFGIGSLLAGIGMWRRMRWSAVEPIELATGYHWSWSLTIALGVGFAGWVASDILMIGVHTLGSPGPDRITATITYAVYASVAVLLLALPSRATVRRHLAVVPGRHSAPGSRRRRPGGATGASI